MADYSEFPTTPTGWQEAAGPGVGDRHPARPPRTPRPPQRRVDLGALVPGVLFVVLAIAADDRAATCRAVCGDGGSVWVLLIGGGVALLLSELRKARRRR